MMIKAASAIAKSGPLVSAKTAQLQCRAPRALSHTHIALVGKKINNDTTRNGTMGWSAQRTKHAGHVGNDSDNTPHEANALCNHEQGRS